MPFSEREFILDLSLLVTLQIDETGRPAYIRFAEVDREGREVKFLAAMDSKGDKLKLKLIKDFIEGMYSNE